MNRITSTEALEISMEIGRILLQNGSTANRVELMMCKVCSIFGNLLYMLASLVIDMLE